MAFVRHLLIIQSVYFLYLVGLGCIEFKFKGFIQVMLDPNSVFFAGNPVEECFEPLEDIELQFLF